MPGGNALHLFGGGTAPLTVPVALPEQSGTVEVTVADVVPSMSLTSAEARLAAQAQMQAQTQMQATGTHRCPFSGG